MLLCLKLNVCYISPVWSMGRSMAVFGVYCKQFPLYMRFAKVGDSSETVRRICLRKTALNSLQRLQSPPNSA